MKKYRNKYRIASARASWWDYASAGAYFITICTAKRRHYFGEINDGVLRYNNLATIADIFWHDIPQHHPMVVLGDFVVMPNHIHGILILNNPADTQIVATRHALPPLYAVPKSPLTPTPGSIGQQRFQNQGKNSISSIIGSYKSAVTKHANRLGLQNGWQSRFHDHIIRNDEEYQRISDYIVNNPSNWPKDKFYISKNHLF